MQSFWSRIHHLPVAIIASVAWMGLIFGLSARSTIPKPPGLSLDVTSIAGHFSVYLVLAVLLYWVLTFLMKPGGRRYLMAWALAVLYGVSDEWHQSFVPGRTPDVFDVMTDGIGAAVGVLIVWWVTSRVAASAEARV